MKFKTNLELVHNSETHARYCGQCSMRGHLTCGKVWCCKDEDGDEGGASISSTCKIQSESHLVGWKVGFVKGREFVDTTH